MGLEIPGEVTWLSWIIGQDWPEGDETAMRRLATAWQDAATGVDDLTGDLQGTASKVLGVVDGPAAESFHTFWDKFVTTDPQYLPKLSETCRALAKQCDDGANEIEYGKYMFIALLIVTAIQIAILIANMIETFGGSAALIPAVEEGAQLVAKSIARQLLEAILKSVAWSELQSVGLDVVVQGIQIAEGHRDGLDLSKTGTAALDGLVNGVIGGGVGFGAGKIPGLSGAASPFKGMVQGAAREAVSGAVSGVAGAAASTAIHGGDLSPDALAKAATSGGFGGAVGGAEGGMHEGAQGGSHGSDDNAPSPGDSDFSGSQNDSGSDGGGSASTTAPHISSDGGGNSVHTTSGDSGGAPPTDSTAASPSHDGTSFNRTNLLGTDSGSTPSSAAPHVSSETTPTSYDGGGSSISHDPPANRIDSLLNGGSSGGGSDHGSPAPSHASTLAGAGAAASAAAPPIGDMPGAPGHGSNESAPNGAAPVQAGPSAGGTPMAPPMAPPMGGGMSGFGGGDGHGPSSRPGGGTTSEPRGYQPSTTGEHPGGTTDRPTAGTERGAGTERPGGPGTDRWPGSSPGDGRDGTAIPRGTDGAAPSTDSGGAGDSHTVGPSGAPVGLHEYAVPGDFHDYGDGIGTNDQRAVPLLEDYKPWGDLPDKAAFDAAYRPDGRVQWPPDEGAAGPARRITLPAGTVLDRFGYPGGEYLSPLRPDGHPYSYEDRAILPDSLAKGYHIYVLDAPVTVDLADVAPAFEQGGGGRQVKLINSDLSTLLDKGVLHEVPSVPSDGLTIPSDYGMTRPDGTAAAPVPVGDTGHQHPETTPERSESSRGPSASHSETTPAEHPSEPRTPGLEPPSSTEPHSGHADDQTHHGDTHDGTDAGGHTPGGLPENLPSHLHDVYGASEETPAGRSLYTSDQQNMRDLAQRVHTDPSHYVMDGHGNAEGMRFGDRTLGARDVADIIRSDPNWNGRDVLLVSCETGAHPEAFAARLSDELGVPVTAPDRPAWTDNQGRIYSSSSEHVTDGRASPTWPPDGGWHTYRPDGSAVASGHDGFPPHHAGEDVPHGPDHDGRSDHAHHAASRGDDTTPDHEPGEHTGTPGAHSDEETPVHAIHPESPFAEPFDPPMDGPVVHLAADDPRVVPDEPFGHRTDLEPGTRYEVEGRGTFWTDQNGHVRYVDAEIPNTRHGQNPDVHHPLPKAQYRVRTDHGELTFSTDKNGYPPAAALYEPPTHILANPGSSPREVPTVTVGAHPDADGSIPPPRPGEGFAHRTDLAPNTRYEVYDTNGNHVGTYTTDGEGHPRWADTDSGRQYRQHPELGKNYQESVQYRLSENFDPNHLKGPDANFDPPPHVGESKITLDSKGGDSLHRRVATNDPFVGRDGLEPNHKYVVEQKFIEKVRGKEVERVQPYAVCYTDSEGKVVAVDTFKPFNTDLNNPSPETQYRVNHLDENGVHRPTLLNTRHPVIISDSGHERTYVGTHSVTHDSDSVRSDNKFRRDGNAQSEVGSVGRTEHPGTRYAGGHGARNAEGMMGEAAGQMPQLHAQNSGLNSDGVTRPESWYQMEEDRASRAADGATIGPINALGAFLPSQGTPRVMWQMWTESHNGQPPRLFIRSFLNVPSAAASSRS